MAMVIPKKWPKSIPEIQKLVDEFQVELEKIDSEKTCKIIVFPKDAPYLNILTRDIQYFPTRKET